MGLSGMARGPASSASLVLVRSRPGYGTAASIMASAMSSWVAGSLASILPARPAVSSVSPASWRMSWGCRGITAWPRSNSQRQQELSGELSCLGGGSRVPLAGFAVGHLAGGDSALDLLGGHPRDAVLLKAVDGGVCGTVDDLLNYIVEQGACGPDVGQQDEHGPGGVVVGVEVLDGLAGRRNRPQTSRRRARSRTRRSAGLA